MIRSRFVTMLIVAAVSCVLFQEATAQSAISSYRLMVAEHQPARHIGSIFTRSFQPVRIISANVPETLEVGEEGLFSAQANVGTATLPIRSAWEFSDGVHRNGLSVRRAFKTPGRHRVHLHVWNPGSEASKTFVVNVRPAEADES